MLCDVCKQNEATVFLTEMVQNKAKKMNLCDACSKSKGVDDPTAFAFADMLLGLGASQEIEQAAEGGDLKCPVCGFTQADFKKAGRFGCPECYHAFADGLEGLLKSMHKGTRHVGKAPQTIQQTRDFNSRLKTLQKQLDKHLAEEDYERAAIVRDEIKQIRQKLSELAVT